MATEIYNDGAALRIINNGNVILLSKLHIKTIDAIRNDTVRIDIGEGPLKNIYLTVDELTIPYGLGDAHQLRDLISGMMVSNVGGGATEANQQQEITLLSSINQFLFDIKTILGRGTFGVKQASRIDESVPNVVYYGYATIGSFTNEPVWAIQRVTRTNDVIVYEWADGNENFDNVWDNRYLLNYSGIGIIREVEVPAR